MGRNGVDLSCDEVVRLVSDYLEGVLTRAEAARFEAHIVMCDGCAAYLDQMRETIKQTSMVTREESITPTLREELVAKFRIWKRERS